jgi:hypothetical protein
VPNAFSSCLSRHLTALPARLRVRPISRVFDYRITAVRQRKIFERYLVVPYAPV